MRPRAVLADNPGPFTLSGTVTYVVGRRDVAVVDPGPDLERHRQRLVEAVADAERVRILLTHHHADHAGGAAALAAALGAPLLGEGHPDADPLPDGAAVETDQGRLVALATPGHAERHLCFHWPDARAVFVGDLVLGIGDTTWVGEYPGAVADYLASLARLRALEPAVLYPAHGPPLEDAAAAIDRYEAHRRERIAQVERALADVPSADVDELVRRVYGKRVPPGLEAAARASVRAILDFLGRDA
ncbi:MAG: MBL fold metallo-hydrolase [Gemmatimonadetes bacterium]|nr:MAG: MBL fold metallo-hydrolase [Gemmatimonadota bacterium]